MLEFQKIYIFLTLSLRGGCFEVSICTILEILCILRLKIAAVWEHRQYRRRA